MCCRNMLLGSIVSSVWLSALVGHARASTISVRVEPQKSVAVVGEPFLVSVNVVNNGRDPVKLIHHNAPTLVPLPRCVVALRFGADKEHLTEWSDRLRVLKKTTPLLLPAGESITVDLVMLFNARDGWFAERRGLYWLQGRAVVAPSPYIEVLSDPIPIEILEPTPSDRTTWQWLDAHKEEYGRLVQIPWEAELSDEFAREAGRLAETSRSVYAEYLALFLSRWYDEGKGKDAEQAARFAEIAKAKASSEKVRSEAEKLLAKFQKKPPQP